MKWGIRKDSKRTASLRQQYRSEKDSYKKDLLKARYQDSKIRDRIDQNRKSFQATGKLKIASPNDFNKIAYEQYTKDKDFKNTVNSLISSYGSKKAQRKYYADRELSEREIGDIVNRANALRSHNDNLNSSYNKMYDALKKKGYSGFIDINDRKYSGYNSKRPTVIIDPDAIKRKGEAAISGFETLHAYHAYRTIRALGVLTASISAIGIATNNHDTNRAATNYYKRTNDSSKGLKEASILENKYNADRLLYGNRGSY